MIVGGVTATTDVNLDDISLNESKEQQLVRFFIDKNNNNYLPLFAGFFTLEFFGQSCDQAVELCGFGKFQIKLLICSGLVW